MRYKCDVVQYVCDVRAMLCNMCAICMRCVGVVRTICACDVRDVLRYICDV